jgi:hypothetical protein
LAYRGGLAETVGAGELRLGDGDVDDALGLGGALMLGGALVLGGELRIGEAVGLGLRRVGGSALGEGTAESVLGSGACAEGADGG